MQSMVRWIVCGVICLGWVRAVAQHAAIYVSTGYQSGVQSEGLLDFRPLINRAQVGGYIDLPIHAVLLGVDARYSGGYGINGALFGPRVAFSPGRSGDLQPYVQGLFGAAHAPTPPKNVTYGDESADNPDSHGICAYAVAGLDYSFADHALWRAVEVTYGPYTGRPGTDTVTVTTGLVFRWSPTARQPGRRSYRKR